MCNTNAFILFSPIPNPGAQYTLNGTPPQHNHSQALICDFSGLHNAGEESINRKRDHAPRGRHTPCRCKQISGERVPEVEHAHDGRVHDVQSHLQRTLGRREALMVR